MAYLNPDTIPAPTADSTDNNYIQDVIGNRSDKSFSNAASHPTLAGSLKAGYYHVHDRAKVWPSGYGAILTVELVPTAGGSGYTLNDVLTVVQTGASGGTVTASAVADGVVTEITLTTGGTGYIADSGLATTGGTGTGCTIEIATSDYYLGKDPIQLTAGASAWLHGAKTEIVAANAIGVWFDLHWVAVSNVSTADDYEIRVFSGAAFSEVEIGRVAFSRTAAQDRSSVYIPVQVPPEAANSRISASLACKAADERTCEVKFYYHTYPDITA